MSSKSLSKLPSVLVLPFLVACGSGSTTGDSRPAENRQERTARLWSASCALCHVTGIGGAPHVGQADEWLPRLAQGDDVLMRHTLEGLNNMPPLGYCMACEREDFVAMIELMTAGIAKPEETTP